MHHQSRTELASRKRGRDDEVEGEREGADGRSDNSIAGPTREQSISQHSSCSSSVHVVPEEVRPLSFPPSVSGVQRDRLLENPDPLMAYWPHTPRLPIGYECGLSVVLSSAPSNTTFDEHGRDNAGYIYRTGDTYRQFGFQLFLAVGTGGDVGTKNKSVVPPDSSEFREL